MHIEKGGLYEITPGDTEITIATPEKVTLLQYEEPSSKQTIRIVEASECTLYTVMECAKACNIHMVTESPGALSKIRCIITGTKDSSTDVDILSQLSASDATTDVHILTLIADQSHIRLNGIVQIDANIAGSGGHILEENIFLGESGKITGIPSLLVHSNDVEASHAAKIERIPDEKLYYLRARGIPKDDATIMMIESAIAIVLDGLPEEKATKISDTIFNAIF